MPAAARRPLPKTASHAPGGVVEKLGSVLRLAGRTVGAAANSFRPVDRYARDVFDPHAELDPLRKGPKEEHHEIPEKELRHLLFGDEKRRLEYFCRQLGLGKEEAKIFLRDFLDKLEPENSQALVELMSKKLGPDGSKKLLYLLVKWQHPEFKAAMELQVNLDMRGFLRKISDKDYRQIDALQHVGQLFEAVRKLEEQKEQMEKMMAAHGK